MEFKGSYDGSKFMDIYIKCDWCGELVNIGRKIIVYGESSSDIAISEMGPRDHRFFWICTACYTSNLVNK